MPSNYSLMWTLELGSPWDEGGLGDDADFFGIPKVRFGEGRRKKVFL